ncbi:MAG: response regulator transcription factor [Gammaproteobacteria bacterium]|nr:response regulator transcription factor [Gammaproteobacteria bacterium]MBU1732817.1 response regulator transcription factor [Gammaproteobacteria bacterium]MBU1891642.1 response regulator transcription factor [Gammaproteobacteria bacterium]
MSVLIVEDSQDLAANIADYLEAKGYLVDVAMDGVTGLHLAVTQPHDVIVLDLMLPGIDGLTLCRRLRQDAKSAVPILMLTARDTLDDKAAGFGEGADDYMVKPFELRELDLRLRALARRARSSETLNRLKVADLVFDLDTLSVQRAGQAVSLPVLPLKILELLMKRTPSVVWRRDIERAVWGDSPPDSDSLRVHMHTLRSAIDPPGLPPLLHTVRGVGYQLKDPDAPAI